MVAKGGMTPEDGAFSEEQCWVLSSVGGQGTVSLHKEKQERVMVCKSTVKKMGIQIRGIQKIKIFSFRIRGREGR